jgi:hypothetical protein
MLRPLPFCFSISVLIFNAAALCGEPAAIPDDKAQKEALATIKDIFKADYAKSKPEERQVLAKKLLDWVKECTDKPALRYELLNEAVLISAKAGDVNAALSTVDRLAENFQIDRAALTKAVLAAAETATKDPELVRLISSLKTLQEKPDDPAANLIVGLNYCLNRADWVRGLPAVAKGSDVVLKNLAAKELSNPTDPKEQAAVGEGWWNLSVREANKNKKQALREHARLWYERALPGINGPEKATLTARVDEIIATSPPVPKILLPATEAGLKWLAAHQESDGHWNTILYGAASPVDTACTGFALLAFVRAGNSETGGAYQKNVVKAIEWLKANQATNGCVYAKTDAGGHRGIGYPHGIAGIALAEAAGASKNADTLKLAQKAIDYSLKVHMDLAGGFRYTEKQAGCISVSGWYFQQMKAAKTAGLTVAPQSFELASKFLSSLEKKENGLSVYTYQPEKDSNRRRTMIGCATRLLFGAKKQDIAPSIEATATTHGYPAWGAGGESCDLYYWHYGTLAMSLIGGDAARQWHDALVKALNEGQCKTGDDTGSWPVVGDFSQEWGRVGQTAVACIALIASE